MLQGSLMGLIGTEYRSVRFLEAAARLLKGENVSWPARLCERAKEPASCGSSIAVSDPCLGCDRVSAGTRMHLLTKKYW